MTHLQEMVLRDQHLRAKINKQESLPCKRAHPSTLCAWHLTEYILAGTIMACGKGRGAVGFDQWKLMLSSSSSETVIYELNYVHKGIGFQKAAGSKAQKKSTPVVITKEDIKRLACQISKSFLFPLLGCGGGIEGTHCCPWGSPLCLRASEVRTLLSHSEFSCILELKFANPDSLSPPESSEIRLSNRNDAVWGWNTTCVVKAKEPLHFSFWWVLMFVLCPPLPPTWVMVANAIRCLGELVGALLKTC